MRISVKADVGNLTRHLNDLQRRVVPTATRRTINKLADQAKSAAAKEISHGWGFKAKQVRDAIRIRRASFRTLIAEVIPSGKRQSLYKHAKSARQTKTGVTVRIGNRTLNYPGAYIARMPSGHVGIFRTKGGRRGPTRRTMKGKHVGQMYKPGLPIQEILAPSIPIAFTHRRTMEIMTRLVREKFKPTFEHELKFAMSKL